ncbi:MULTISPECIES: hypothetical protein [unclassified Coleofasciculus]|uniref:hypothetical protein n=1 Tax=unclassified Coleofasciculus TaxID=2692782 RepID=UPI00188235D9|nr:MULTISPECIES: hypothetical protein [unclassified Coleofasciculus]MBE9126970.1 hypothetical protein [Coleofasciculus sp. LEGE 07081]MBE9150347.1 hypothetical protein [Coleofasciculus sp. LEGE 07092]
MADNLISTTVSPKQLKFKPGGLPASFEVTVVNESDRFATFQLEVTAAGADSNQPPGWYNISPEVSTKKPPGDVTKFHVAILDTPVPGFVGLMNLTVRTFSMELPDEDREVLRLNLEQGTGAVPLQLELPVREFQDYPDDLVKIPVRLYNPGQLLTNVVLRLLGLEPEWLVEGIERQLQLAPGGHISETFICQLPSITEASSQVYPFKIEATHSNGPTSWVEGTLEILPKGVVEFTCNPKKHKIPSKRTWLPNWRNPPVVYDLKFENRSNLQQQVQLTIQGDDQQQCIVELPSEPAEISPGQMGQAQVVVKARRHWLGRVRQLFLEAVADLSDERLGSTNPTDQTLKLDVYPIIPTWLLLGGGLLLLYLAWWLSWLNPDNPWFGHHAAVNSVQFNGMSQNVVSGSSDQTLIKWRVDGFFNPFANQQIDKIANTGKAVRVIRYTPVNNNVVAAGLENGEIRLLNLLGETPLTIDSFFYQKDDRVLALEFTDDSRYLFSGHGSGLVVQWDVQRDLDEPLAELSRTKQPIRGREMDFAVYALQFVGQDSNNLAIAGRFNQLVLWNLPENSLLPVPYRKGGQDDYILSVDVAQLKPYLLATSDNQGYITLWNMKTCLVENESCEVLDQWSNGHGGQPVRSVALSNGGCYLASAGDDGRMKLWPLTTEGKRGEGLLSGIDVGGSKNRPINTIDLNVLRDKILVASGSDDTQVRVNKVRRQEQLGCDRD